MRKILIFVILSNFSIGISQNLNSDLSNALSLFNDTSFYTKVLFSYSNPVINDTIIESTYFDKRFIRRPYYDYLVDVKSGEFVLVNHETDTMFVGDNYLSLYQGVPSSQISELKLMFNDILSHLTAYTTSYVGVINNEREYTISNGTRMTMNVFFDVNTGFLNAYSMDVNRPNNSFTVSSRIYTYITADANDTYFKFDHYYSIVDNLKVPNSEYSNYTLIEL